MDEAKLIDQLRKVEALFAGATTPGEEAAAGNVRERLLKQLELLQIDDPPEEYQFSMSDQWERIVLVALLRRYGLRPYRYPRQRRTTVMVRVSPRFLDKTLLPELDQITRILRQYLLDVTQRVVTQVLEADSSEPDELDQPRRLR